MTVGDEVSSGLMYNLFADKLLQLKLVDEKVRLPLMLRSFAGLR